MHSMSYATEPAKPAKTLALLGALTLAFITTVWAFGTFGSRGYVPIQGDVPGDVALSEVVGPTFALVRFDSPRDPARLLEGIGRVDAGIGKQGVVALPEGADIGVVDAVVVYDDGEALRELATRDGVSSVAAVPEGSAWGSFALNP